MASKNKPKGDGYRYVITSRYAKKSFLGWINPDTEEHVNLIGPDLTTKTNGTSRRPPKDITYKAATQRDLKKYWELGAVEVAGEMVSSQGVVIRIKDEENENESSDQG